MRCCSPLADAVSPHPSAHGAVCITVTKDGVKFSTSGDIGSANITCRQNSSADKVCVASSWVDSHHWF